MSCVLYHCITYTLPLSLCPAYCITASRVPCPYPCVLHYCITYTLPRTKNKKEKHARPVSGAVPERENKTTPKHNHSDRPNSDANAYRYDV